MGLDWCVEDKAVLGAEDKLKWADAQIEKVNEEFEIAWVSYRELVDAPKVSASVYPNEDWRNFLESADAKDLESRRVQWTEERLKHVTTPQQTLGAPRVGFCEKADAFLAESYSKLCEGDDSQAVLEEFPSLGDYQKGMHGKYIYELIPEENRDGLGAVTGIFAGGESFRGKSLNYVPWLEGYQDELAWYCNKTPDELVSMGRLLQELHDARAEEGHPGEAEAADLRVVKQASTWCIFWGTKGHSMYAWY